MKTAAPPKLGSINACGLAYLLDASDRRIVQCLATPNNIAAAFAIHKDAVAVRSAWPLEMTGVRDDYRSRMAGLDMKYHRKHIRRISK